MKKQHLFALAVVTTPLALALALPALAYGPGGFAPVAYHPQARGSYGAPVYGYWVAPPRAGHAANPYLRQHQASRAPVPVAAPEVAKTAESPPPAAPASPVTRPATPAVPRAAAATPLPGAGAERVPAVIVERIPDDLTSETPVAERKERFLAILTPLVLLENERLTRLREEVQGLVARLESDTTLSDDQGRRLAELARRYRVDGDPASDPAARRDLLSRVDTIPVSLALAQAANESAWGVSRFAREARNLFGIWTYDESKGLVPKRRSPGQKHLVRRFDSLQASVRYYMHTLNSHPAYAALRQLRAAYRAEDREPSGMVLSEGLEKYSAKGETYVRIIQEMIEDNQLSALEDARLAG